MYLYNTNYSSKRGLVFKKKFILHKKKKNVVVFKLNFLITKYLTLNKPLID